MIKNLQKIIIGIISIVMLSSCKDKPPVVYPGHFPDFSINFGEINSEFDDYNSDIQILGDKLLFHFSSNRKSQGQHFDIIGERLFLRFNQISGIFTFETDSTINWYENIESMIDSVNSLHDEFGPYSFSYSNIKGGSVNNWISLLMYSSDAEGSNDIYFIYTPDEQKTMSSSQKLGFIDMDANELYPSFFGIDFYFHDEWGTDPSKIMSMVYCSDKDGQFDIYNVELTQGADIITTLSSSEILESQKLDLSSSYDDKCPYVNGYLMVFASNRIEGFGGYDLYYSQYENGNWSTPINFGDKINTEYDEFRPITLREFGFDNNLMIFSSNRLGGKGGFDLYYVGIDKMIE